MPRRSDAFTLVEFMVAAAIATLVTMVMFAVFRATSTTFESVEADRRVFDKAVNAVESVSRDLTCSVRMPLGGTMYFLLDQGTDIGDSNSDLSFHTATSFLTQDDTEQFQVERIRYSLLPARDGDRPAMILARTAQVLAADGTPGEQMTENIAVGVEMFKVAFFDGTMWHETWPTSEAKRPVPIAARISLSCRQGRLVRTFESTAVIRFGMPL
ncbi:MAG: prepilin-type N-terminal cleavage/methylation domain-containing protein [bacterium]